ncbi:glycosyltransferase family 4 protein [Chryseobacterium sp. NFX27]|uniref:glycosyltransferase family 4 protein n=1 Tax=Chryseobacterium sp. NFX27 TaxID=2819618 RepID=UPI003CF6786C
MKSLSGMQKKILIDAERLKYPKSGIANVCISLIRGLDERTSDFEYTFYGPKKNIPQTKKNFNIIDWKFWQKKFPINTQSFSLIHTAHQLSKYFHTVKEEQKKVVTLHDLNFLHDGSTEQKVKKYTKLVQKNLGNADAIVCISEFVKEDFLKNRKLFTLKNDVKVKVIYNGLIFPETTEFASEHSYGFIGKKYILNIGVLFPKKNQEVLLDLISKNDRDLVLVTSSAKSAYKEKFLEKIKKLGLESRVHILENIDNSEKYFLLQHCESYCHPSLAEGFGIPPVEAMYFGKPVFLSKLTSLPEIGGDLAFYFDNFSAEHMQQVYASGMQIYGSRADEYASQLKQKAMKFGYLEMAGAYEKLYSELLN